MAKPEIATERTRLSIPFDDRQRAIRAAGKLADGSNALDYVKEEKVWYAQPGANLSRLKEWIFDPNKVIEEPPLDIQAIEDEFTAWLEERGAIIKDPIEFDGQKHYVDTVDGKAGSRKGVYAAFLDGRPAGWYRDYKNGGEIQKWVSTGAAPNPEQMAMLRADAAARREQRAAAQADKFDQTANRLMEEYNRLPDATGDLAYLKNKQVIAANGLKADERGNVVIPLFNADGEFRTLERIWSDGSKHLEKDGQAWGSFFVVGGQLKDGDNLLYAEGYATAASISEAINQPVIMTVNAGNMVEVAGRLKDTFPNSTHYFLADNDIYKDENVGLEKATEAAELTAGHVLVPAFSNPKEGLTDYNDLHVSEGLEQVRLQVEGAINQMNRVDTMPTDNPNITDVNHSSTDSAAVADPEKAAPVASAPAAAEPEETAPVASAPAADEPVEAAQVASAPAADEPVEVAPVASAPAADEPEEVAPVASAPAAAEPEETAPVASAPAAAEPEEAAPVASAPAAAEPEETAPVASAPAAAEPEEVAPVASAPAAAEPEETAPVASAPAAAEPEETAPVASAPAAAEPEEAVPVSSTPAAAEPEYTAPTDRDGDDEESNSASDLEAYAAMMAFGGETTDSAQQKPERIAPSESVANTAPAENETEEKKKTNEELENGIRWATNDNAETPPKERIDLEGLIARFGYRAEKDYTAYTLDGQDAFYDYGSHLRMATPEASQSDEMILAAVLTADKQHHRGIEITGSDEFKERVFNLISEYNIEVKLTNPEQRVKLLELKKANETAKETAKENVADSNANKQEGANEKTNSSVQQNGMRWEESASVQPKKQNASDTQKEDKAAGEPWEKGVIVAHGRAKYEWKEDESMNYFVTLKNEHGEKTLWGKDLERAVKDAGVDTERLVTVRKLGFVDVEVNAPVRDESNKIVRYETIQTKRNEWEVKPVYPQPTAGNEQAYKPSELVPYDAATFQKLRTTIQQITGVDLSREAVPEKELYWFLPNGKPAPESMTKPTGYKLPQESKTAGTPLLIAPHKKGERPDYFLVESRKGFMQGIAKDKESGEYHSVIGKVNKRIDKDGNWKTYMTLSAINKNAESGIVLHGYGHVDQGGKNLLYKNTIANEKQPQHLQAASDEVKNKTVMKQLFHPSNSAKRKDDERREQTHAPVAKSAPRP
ncbi:LPD7 domain-containing protein [Klebsiella pneumoniae]|uniref:LPD7 domain-containing protein n=3 Tax=Klebsiella pneumoniae TaxID=573 RepID=UPI000E2AB58C|nr:LPD7 domain-containing protein [Klebsiella pneumoniae]SWF41096.1 Zinc binding domain / DNA primase [Klebsiella pneumoniae]SWM59978.1 Zinc binding domain / DNA primase [Klebsiella pneumoniae]SXN70851.1 Zinc binding domain / DNA primase [Klebsiella pneumoniae]SXP94884.1 Zinc binding domain / DNA primase [Klebsiella pneumoniae]